MNMITKEDAVALLVSKALDNIDEEDMGDFIKMALRDGHLGFSQMGSEQLKEELSRRFMINFTIVNEPEGA
jgi:hypothetical protein